MTGENVATSAPNDLKNHRLRLGLTEEQVGERLLLSVAQVRGIESGSVTPFYNEGFYERARDKYVGFLTTYSPSTTPTPPVRTGLASPDDDTQPRMTLGDLPVKAVPR